ncbi:metallophosphoesterase [Salinisphaera hydrothermalis]|uniref:Calcineurin-like phosphoesterase n=1 Tax=Salinisphaera hydrothermalis (strain C41B8) TaxID=1304275 RepID=A0A084IIN3_SALHC|nr:metallophosphoesterase [Salinisphaera hydrothermalis]KEZ76567.1 Calcineurin-like phosphoesterase [Salinisphaera hydrothermalis C41B8]
MGQAWDVVGDVHGFADDLIQLLEKLGYEQRAGVYRHPNRRVLFLGDFIDGGNQNRRVMEIVRPMVDAGGSLAIMGNHEYNAICYHTRDPDQPGGYLRAHSKKNLGQHENTLAEFDDPAALQDMIEWFKTLPLFIEIDGLRAVHACWDPAAIESLRSRLGERPVMSESFLVESCDKASAAHDAVETVLKGLEFELPAGITFKDKYGQARREARIRWWMENAESLDKMVIGPPGLDAATAGHNAERSKLVGYEPDLPPIFFGHYWLTGEPRLQGSNVACLDYSVARGGKLVAYRWDGEQMLDESKLVW